MSELTMLTELKELTEQKSPNQNKQRVLVRHRLPQAVGTVTKRTIHINAKDFLFQRFGIIDSLPVASHTSLAAISHQAISKDECCLEKVWRLEANIQCKPKQQL